MQRRRCVANERGSPLTAVRPGLEELARKLDVEDAWIFAWDQRGHGRFPGERGWAESFSTLVRDVDAFVRHFSREHAIPVENMAAVAYSFGSVLLAAWVHDYAPPLRAMVLATPAFRVKLYVPFALSLLRADREGYTQEEHDRLARPFSILSPRGWPFAMQRLLLGTIGRLSRGIRIGWRTGFDSGSSLDYVYENRARGFTPVGRLIDRLYLNQIGWKGIRERKKNLQATVRRAIREVAERETPVRIVDVAAGPGRYLLEVLEELPPDRVCAVLRDRSAQGLRQGRELALEMNLANVVYEERDAFDNDWTSARPISPGRCGSPSCRS